MKIVISTIAGLFDIYSRRPSSRVAVAATMLVGVLLLLRDLGDRSMVGALPFLVLVVANRIRFLQTLESLLEKRPSLLLFVPMLVLFGRFLIDPPTATDDLLRHIAVAAWGGDYQRMYVHTYLPSVNFYVSFDWLVARISGAIGFESAMWAMQALAVGSFVTVFAQAARRVDDDHALAMPMTVLMLCATLLCMGYRLILGRPEIFLLIWGLAACAVVSLRGSVLWVASGAVLSTGYWLAPVVFPAALLLPVSLRQRLLAVIVLLLAWAAFWGLYGGVEFVGELTKALWLTANRVQGNQVTENQTVLAMLTDPLTLVLLLASVLALRQPGADHRLALLAGYFSLSNQVRYLSAVVPLLALHALSAACPSKVRWPAWPWRSAALAISIACVTAFSGSVPRYRDLPRFPLPDGAIVLTGFREPTFSTLFANPGKVRVAPAMEIGWLEPRLQKVVASLGQGRFDCDALRGYAFSHLIESTLSGSTPACLTLEETQGPWRLWRIRQ